MDFRLPQYRREVFLRFYEFHLKYRTHPGLVYLLMPGLADHRKWSSEQRYWFAYINGNTQNPVTSLLIFNRFPTMRHSTTALAEWFNSNYARLAFDMDRRYQKKEFLKAVNDYRTKIGNRTQTAWFTEHASKGWGHLWKTVRDFAHFGRLSTWSYLEYLSIAGLLTEPEDLMLVDMSGSKSHRNGLCKVLGRDDLDWHKSNSAKFEGGYPPETMKWLKSEQFHLLADAKNRLRDTEYYPTVNFFTLESALCTYKSWHRVNRRYPNCYSDMLHDRIKAAEQLWPEEDLSIFWDLRNNTLPQRLRQEDTIGDPGLSREKQNYYRLNGCPVMLSGDWPCFENAFDVRLGIRNEPVRDI